jgi:2,3-bisphosphoglycerate-dependent phosphoglycerate mutase
MRNVYVVAHAQSQHHIEKRVGGWYDTPLTALGSEQAHRVGRLLAEATGEDALLFSSDLRRAAETAEIIGSHVGVAVTLDRGLREMSYGEAEGRSTEWADAHLVPTPSDGNRLDHRIFPGAETRRELATRVRASLNSILELGATDTVIVTHGFALTFLVMTWLGVPIEHMGYCNLPSRPGGVTHLHEDDLFRNRGIRYLNRTDHLAP